MSTLLDDLETPCLVIDLDRLKSNGEAIRSKSQQIPAQLRTDVAEHRCREIAEIATNGSKRCIAVSCLAQAEFFAEGGFDDILYTPLLTADKLSRLNKLAARLQIHLLVDSVTAVDILESNPVTGQKWSIFVLVDCGHGPGGIQWDDSGLVPLTQKITASPHLDLEGLYVKDASVQEIKRREMEVEEMMDSTKGYEIMTELNKATMDKFLEAAKRLQEAGVKYKTLSGGSTASVCHPAESMKQLTEVHPSDYLLNDLRHANIGVCTVKDIAMRVATRVIGHYPHKKQLLIDAGSVAVGLEAKDVILPDQHLIYVYNHPGLVLRSLTEDVGIIEARKRELDFKKYPIGSILYLVPFHARSTANLYQQYYIQQDQKIVAVWEAAPVH